MRWVVSANDVLKEEFLIHGAGKDVNIEWVADIQEFTSYPGADAFFDLLFEPGEERVSILRQFLPKPVFINSVVHTLNQAGNSFIRINGWPSFLKRSVVEAACMPGTDTSAAERIFRLLNRTPEWLPDIPGFISARVVAMIVNEAYFALEENVSTKEETDIAMKLGTNYPYGPFEWAEKIGLKNIYSLLQCLSETEKRYQPAALLKKEALI